VDGKSESGKSREEDIRQRLAAIRTRKDELRAMRHDDAGPATVSERTASAQRQAAASQAAAEQAIAASVRAFRRAAEAHEHAARQHERAAAAGFGDKDQHERQAARHRAAAVADTQRADRAELRNASGPDRSAPVSTLRASVSAGESGPVITLSGETDMSTVAELSELVTAQLSGGTRHLTIDASGLGFADSASVRVLVLAARTLQQRGGGLTVLRPRRAVARMLEIVGADQVITVRGETEARAEPEPEA
jgi:anti-anti-sigma factor